MEFYDNPARDEDFYVELDDNLRIPLQFKGTKCTFLSRVLTRQELETRQNFDMTSDHEWDPQSIDINNIRKISQARRLKRSVLRVQRYTVYISPSSDLISYQYPTSDEDILSEINPSLVHLKEFFIAQINIQGHDNEHFLARRTFVSCKQHSDITAESLSEIWGTGPKRAKAILLATTQNVTRSVMITLSRHYRSYLMYNLKHLQGHFATDTFYADIKYLHGNTCCRVNSHKVWFYA